MEDDPPARIPANEVAAPFFEEKGAAGRPTHRRGSQCGHSIGSRPMKNPLFYTRAAALALAATVFPSFAQTSLDQVVVTAARTQERLQDALPATTLITREDIERAQTPDLPTLLRRVAGLEIAQAGGQGTVSSP